MWNSSRHGTPERGATPLTARLFTNSAIYGFTRLLGLLSLLLVSPAVAATYGLVGLGAYAAMLSLITFLASVDSGIGGGVRSGTAELLAANPDANLWAIAKAARRRVRTWVLGAAAVASLVGAGVPWDRAFDGNGTGEAPLSALGVRATVVGFALLYLAGVYLQTSTRVLEGAQRNASAAVTGVGPPLLVMFFTLLACQVNAPFWAVVLIAAVAPIVQGATATMYIGRSRREQVSPHPRSEAPNVAASIAVPMTAISLAYAASYSLDYWIVGALLGGPETGIYSAAARPAQLMLVVATAVGPVLWTHFARARAVKDHELFRRRRVVQMSLGFASTGIAAGVLYVVGVSLLGDYLTAQQGQPSRELVVSFGLWGALMVAHQPLAMMLNDSRGLRLQMGSMLVMTASNIALSLFLVSRIGSSGAVIASVVALAGVHVPVLVWGSRRALGEWVGQGAVGSHVDVES